MNLATFSCVTLLSLLGGELPKENRPTSPTPRGDWLRLFIMELSSLIICCGNWMLMIFAIMALFMYVVWTGQCSLSRLLWFVFLALLNVSYYLSFKN